jgi:SynChlorMet cassette protein ScmC
MALTPLDICQEDPGLGPRTDTWNILEQLTGFTEPDAASRMRGYSLHLGDGSRWWIAGSEHASFIAEKLATIMQLQEGDPGDGHLMFFYEKNADHQRLDVPRLQAQGWISLKHFFFQISFQPRLRHFLGEYDTGNPKSSPYGLMCEALPSVYWESIYRGGLPFHAAFLEHQGQGVILAAAGETGKSTCSRRVPPPWRARCDDEGLVVLSPEGRYLAHPFPTWTDYLWERAENTWKVEEAMPLAGIFFLEQAPNDDVLPLEGAQAAIAAVNSAGQIMARFLSWCDAASAREVRGTVFANACELVKQVPTFRLRVSLTGRFWEKIEAALGWR